MFRSRVRLLGIGLLLAGATQLRFAGPVGPGECLLLAWAAWSLWSGRRSLKLNPPRRVVAVFLGLAGVLLVLGWIVAVQEGKVGRNAAHSSVALLFSGGLMAAALLSPQPGRLRIVAKDLTIGAGVLLAIVYVSGVLGLGGSILEPWWPSRGRFQGWAVNPNQLAFQLVALPFFALALMPTAKRPAAVLLAGIAVTWLALATASKAVVVAWLAGAGMLWLVTRTRLSTTLRADYGRHGTALLLFMAVATLLVTTLVWPRQLLLARYFSEVTGASQAVTTPFQARRSRKLLNRRLLALNGIAAAADSPLIGWGPGSHSGFERPHGGQEAHVTPIDWAASTGGLGLLALAGLGLYVARRAWLYAPRYLPLLTVVGTFGLFHNLMRQPLWWLLPVLVIDATLRSPRSDAGDPSSLK